MRFIVIPLLVTSPVAAGMYIAGYHPLTLTIAILAAAGAASLYAWDRSYKRRNQ